MNSTVIIAIVLTVIAASIFYLSYAFRKIKNMPVAVDNEKIKILTDQNFQEQLKKGITLVDFWAEWCMPCKMMAPILNTVAEELNEKASIGKIDIEQFQSTPSKYGVRSIPTLILFKDGVEVNRYIGVKQKDFLLKEINKYIN